MRLGSQAFHLERDILLYRIYGSETWTERHRHRYEVNDHFLPQLEAAGLRVCARSIGSEALCEAIELPNHPWFIGVQFHPEFTSTPRGGHPLFSAYIQAAIVQAGKKA